MKVKLLCSRAGPTLSQKAGDIIEVSSDEAKRMIFSGQAVAIKGAPKGAPVSTKPKKKDEE